MCWIKSPPPVQRAIVLEKKDHEIGSVKSHIIASLVRIISVLKKDSLSRGIPVISRFKSLNSKPTDILNSEHKQWVTQWGLFWTVFFVCLFVPRDWINKALCQVRVSSPRFCSLSSTLAAVPPTHEESRMNPGISHLNPNAVRYQTTRASPPTADSKAASCKRLCHLHRHGKLPNGQTEFVFKWQLHQHHITRVKRCRVFDGGMALSNKNGKSILSNFPQKKRCSERKTGKGQGVQPAVSIQVNIKLRYYLV